MDLLATFLAVHDAGKVSAAAKQLHLSQPAVTAQVRRLEDQLGVPLFVRSVRGVSPTDAGARLAVRAREIRRMLDEVASPDTLAGELAIAASTTAAAHVLPPLLAGFRRAHPEVELRVEVGNTQDVLDAVRRGSAPLGIVEGLGRASGLHLEKYVDDELVPIVGRGMACDLATTPILWREAGSGSRAVVERALSRAGIRRRARTGDLELGSTEAIISGAIAGLGVGFVSRFSIRAHLAANLLRIALDLVVRRALSWAIPPGGLHGAAARFHALASRGKTT